MKKSGTEKEEDDDEDVNQQKQIWALRHRFSKLVRDYYMVVLSNVIILKLNQNK